MADVLPIHPVSSLSFESWVELMCSTLSRVFEGLVRGQKIHHSMLPNIESPSLIKTLLHLFVVESTPASQSFCDLFTDGVLALNARRWS